MLDYSFESVFENLALEETLAQGTTWNGFRRTVRLWVDPPAVVIGRFQDLTAEVDSALCEKNSVPIARRFTGGGAVFHDGGNLNFTVVMEGTERMPPSKLHENFSSIVMDALGELGVKTSFFPPNSILVSGRKVSGGAAAFGKHFIFWHSSILVSTDTNLLENVLSPSRKATSKGFIRSRWREVTTLQDALGRPVRVEEVKHQLARAVERALGVGLELDDLRGDEKEHSALLLAQKYSSPQWNIYGHLPKTLERKGRVSHTTIAV